MRKNKKIGLSLSGGGYRATAYHLGTFLKLREMGILEDIDVISTVSGGSITGALYGLHKGNFRTFQTAVKKGVQANVVTGIMLSPRFLLIAFCLLGLLAAMVVLLFTKYAWVMPVILLTLFVLMAYEQFFVFPVSKIIEELYDRHFFQRKKLKDLPGDLKIAINSTNLETGTLFTFSRGKMSDASYEYPKQDAKPVNFKPDEFPIARAVVASTCVPFAFTPVTISKEYFADPHQSLTVNPRLVDGGVYDNQGIHKITQRNSSYRCDIIIISDAGNNLPFQSAFRNTIALLIRTCDVFMSRIKDYQMIQHIYEKSEREKTEIAYQSLGWNTGNCIGGFINNLKQENIPPALIGAHRIDPNDIIAGNWNKIEELLKSNVGYDEIRSQEPTDGELELARNVKTSLSTLSEAEVSALIKQASCITEIQVKLYCPTLTRQM